MSLVLLHGVLLLRRSLTRHTPVSTARIVRQSLDAMRQKALRPCVHKATADPDLLHRGQKRLVRTHRPAGILAVSTSKSECMRFAHMIPRKCQNSRLRVGVRVLIHTAGDLASFL